MTVSYQRLKLFYSKYFQLEKFSVFWIVNTWNMIQLQSLVFKVSWTQQQFAKCKTHLEGCVSEYVHQKCYLKYFPEHITYHTSWQIYGMLFRNHLAQQSQWQMVFFSFIYSISLSPSLSLSLFSHSQLVLFGKCCLIRHFLVWWLSCPKYPLLWSEGLRCSDDRVVASGEEKEEPGGEDEGEGEDGEAEGEQDGGEGWVENYGDKNCKQMEGERSARKMVTAVSHKMRNSFLTVSMYKEPKYKFIQNPAFALCKKEPERRLCEEDHCSCCE